MAQLGSKDLGDAREHGVACEVAVGVVDLTEQVEVGHDQGERAVEALGSGQLLVQHRAEVPRVEEPGLCIDARLLFETRNVERPVDEHEGRGRERDEPDVSLPEAGDADPERGEHEIGRDVRDREQAGLTRSMPAPEVEHQGEQKVVEPHEDETGREPGERCAGLTAV